MRPGRIPFSPWIAPLVLLALAPSPGTAQIVAGAPAWDVYVDMQANGIKGNSNAAGRAGWSDGLGAGLKIAAEVSYRAGGGLVVGKAQADPLHWSQYLDRTYPQMMALTPKLVANPVAIDFVAPGLPAASPMLSLSATRTLFTALSFDGPVANAALAYSGLSLSYRPAGSTPQQALTASWNVLNGTTTAPAAGATPPLDSQPYVADFQVHQYLRLADGNSKIFGDSMSSGYENWIDVTASHFGMSTGSSITSAGTLVGKAAPDSFTWLQAIDRSLPYTFARIAAGQALPTATLEYALNTQGGPQTFMQLTLTGGYLTDFVLSEGLVQQSMAFKTATQTVWSYDLQGRRTGSSAVTWDLPNGSITAGGSTAAGVSGFGAGNQSGVPLVGGGLPPPVPEPQAWALLLAGLGALIGIAARRSRQRGRLSHDQSRAALP